MELLRLGGSYALLCLIPSHFSRAAVPTRLSIQMCRHSPLLSSCARAWLLSILVGVQWVWIPEILGSSDQRPEDFQTLTLPGISAPPRGAASFSQTVSMAGSWWRWVSVLTMKWGSVSGPFYQTCPPQQPGNWGLPQEGGGRE